VTQCRCSRDQGVLRCPGSTTVPRRCLRHRPVRPATRVAHHRYYDPATEQFLSVDPLANVTGTSYAFAADDPVNAFDPNGLDCGIFSFACSAYDATAGGVKTAAAATGHAVNEALPDIHKYLGELGSAASLCAVVTSETVIVGAICGSLAVVATAASAGAGVALYAEGRESGTTALFDVGAAATAGLGGVAETWSTAAHATELPGELAQVLHGVAATFGSLEFFGVGQQPGGFAGQPGGCPSS